MKGAKKEDFYYVDKTLLVKELLDNKSISDYKTEKVVGKKVEESHK